jgi:hypothetical protein
MAMTQRNPKLELTWIGKENRPKLEPRILLEDPGLSYHASHRVTDQDIFDNRLIFGDNLLALKALEQEFAGKIKCVFIDPPYNTGSAFVQYDDGVEHSIWLSLIRDRLEIIQRLLAADGSLWITIDDTEAHYLKVLCDEVFGRFNFVANVVWQKKYTIANDSKWLAENHDHIAPSLLEKDRWGNWVINKQYNPAMLAEALCKLEGFEYAPSDAVYWQHGHSTERDFIYVTTQTLSPEQLAQLSDEVGQERSLLVLCLAFRGGSDRYPNLTVKKIPKTVLARCEWGHDDYSLKVENLPSALPKVEPESPTPAMKPEPPDQPALFDLEGGSR